jgi:hypothetical protein
MNDLISALCILGGLVVAGFIFIVVADYIDDKR